jgi:hypothetical protein
MNRITKRSTKNLMVLTIVATIAAIFMIPAGLANASHAESFGTLTKTTTCPPMTQFVQATCNITVTWVSDDANPDRIVETIPAGFGVTAVSKTALEADGCTVEPSNANGKSKSNGKSKGVGSTKITCKGTDIDINFNTESRETKSGKQKPTSCDEPFETNGGVTVTQLDANMDVVLVPSHNEAGEFLDEDGNVVLTEAEAALVPSTMSAPEESADVTCAE